MIQIPQKKVSASLGFLVLGSRKRSLRAAVLPVRSLVQVGKAEESLKAGESHVHAP